MDIREVSILSGDAMGLIAQLDRELLSEYEPTDMHGVDFESFHRDGGIFMIGYLDQKPAACGGLRAISTSDVELKRMFVSKPNRGRGLARRMLAALEAKARSAGHVRLVLETGDEQHAAIALYQNSGYQRIGPFGEYVDGPRSVCFAKQL